MEAAAQANPAFRAYYAHFSLPPPGSHPAGVQD